MRDKIQDHIASINRYAHAGIQASIAFLRMGPPDLFNVDSVDCTIVLDKPWLTINMSSEFDFDIASKQISFWLGQEHTDKTEHDASTRYFWRTDTVRVTLYCWKHK